MPCLISQVHINTYVENLSCVDLYVRLKLKKKRKKKKKLN